MPKDTFMAVQYLTSAHTVYNTCRVFITLKRFFSPTKYWHFPKYF